MSSTLTGVLSLDRRLYLVHAGDSRCCRLRGSRLNQLTFDHTQAELKVDAGAPDRKAARRSTGGNRLWNYLTNDSQLLRPDLDAIPLAPGDILLLCTDGVSDAVPTGEIQQHLSSGDSAERICRNLIAAARVKGGGDDLTAIVARFGDLTRKAVHGPILPPILPSVW